MAERALTISDFARHRGEAVAVTVGDGTLRLKLAEAQELPPSGREGGAFRLEFRGPLQPALAQGIYRFTVGGAAHDIFIVPIGVAADAMLYEAIFF